jgi:DNA repair exonuclease SbcCD ATPase subunit
MAETRTVNLEIKDNVKSLKTQYKEAVQELQRLAATYGETSVEAQKAAQKAAGLKDQIEDTNDLLQSFKGEGTFIAMNKAMTAVASGFSAVQGGMALVGVEGEAVQETLLKVQSAMALAQGLEGLEDAGRAFTTLQTKIGGMGTKALSAFKAMTTASKAFMVTGIGLLITGVGLLIANWDSLTKKETFNYDEFKKNQEQKLQILDAQQKALDRQYNTISNSSNEAVKGIEREIKIAELQGKNTKKLYEERAKLSQESSTAAIKATEEERQSIKDRYKFLEESEGNSLYNTKLYLQNKANLESDNFKSTFAKELTARKVAAFEEAKALRERAIQLKSFRDSEFDKADAAEDEIKIMKLTKQKELQDKAKQIRDADLAELKNYIKEANTLTSQLQLDDTEKSIDDVKRKYARQLELAKKYGKGLAEIETAMLNEINDIRLIKVNESIAIEQKAREDANNNKISLQREFDNIIEALAEQNFQNTLTEEQREIQAVNDKYFELQTLAKGNAEQLAIIEKAKADELGAIEKKANDKSVEEARAVAEQKAAIQQQGLDTALQGVQLIKGLFEKSKGVQKAAVIAESAIGIAKMIISNKLANAGALATPQAIATSGAAALPVIALNNISTGIGIAANIAATAKALKSLGGGSAPSAPAGGGGGGGGGASTTPQFNTIGSSGVNQLAQLQQQPVQAYVVSGEVTSAQSLDRNRIQNATL